MAVLTLRTVDLPSGERIPVLGQGTWHLGQGHHARVEELQALRVGIELGMNSIDTAEMYGDGAAEEIVGEAIAGRRGDVFLVSKVLPSHATRQGTEGFEELRAAGLIRHLSTFDLSDMEPLLRVDGGSAVQTDQVLYNLARRSIEWDLLPWCLQNGLPVMAYSPVEQGRLLEHPVLRGIAVQYRVSPAQGGARRGPRPRGGVRDSGSRNRQARPSNPRCGRLAPARVRHDEARRAVPATHQPSAPRHA